MKKELQQNLHKIISRFESTEMLYFIISIFLENSYYALWSYSPLTQLTQTHPTFPTPQKSFVLKNSSFSKLCSSYCSVWPSTGVLKPKGHISKENWLSAPNSYQLPKAPWLGVRHHVHIPFPCWDFVWLEFMLVLNLWSQLWCLEITSWLWL